MSEAEQFHTLFMLSDNETGVLARVTGLFSARGYLIQSLTAGEINEARHLSCITITTTGTAPVIAQIKAQLEKIVAIREVYVLSYVPQAIQRELILVRALRNAEHFKRVMDELDILDARQIAAHEDSITYEVSGDPRALDQYILRLNKLDDTLIIVRSGIVGLVPQLANL